MDCGIDGMLSGNWRSTRKNDLGCNQSFLEWSTLEEQQISEVKGLQVRRDV